MLTRLCGVIRPRLAVIGGKQPWKDPMPGEPGAYRPGYITEIAFEKTYELLKNYLIIVVVLRIDK